MRHLLTVVCILLTAGLALAASMPAYALERADRDTPRGIDPALKAKDGMVRVFITLKDQPALAAMQRHEALQRKILGIGAKPVARPANGNSSPYISDKERAVGAWRIEQRERAIKQADRYLLAPLAQIKALKAEIESVGGKLLEAHAAPAGVLALLPSSTLERIAELSYVQAIQPQPKDKPLLDMSVPSTGAPTWLGGYNGGTGNPVNVGISTEDVKIDHPWFGNITGVTPPGYVAGTPDHGTAVASVIYSENDTYEGVAPGLSKINYGSVGQSFCGGVSSFIWHLGGKQNCTNNDNILTGTVDPVEVINYSAGNVPQTDTTSNSDAADYTIFQFEAPQASAAGNISGANKVNDPCIGYNTTCVGGIDHMDTPNDSTDDVVYSDNSNGPTIGGRKKPDISAPSGSGMNNIMVAWYFGGGYDVEGTSFAAPHVTGAYALLIGDAGIPGLPAKAVLINSASPISGQADGEWDAGAGWGELDLKRAFNWRQNWATSTIAANKAKFFQVNNITADDKTTLTWYRRSYKPAQNSLVTHTLTNLDLSLYAPDQTQPTSSSSAIDNVELIKGADQATAYVKVDANSTVEGASSEPFAVASSNSLTEVDGPTFDIDSTLSTTQAKQGQQVTVTADVTNTGELSPSPADPVELTIDLPVGVTLEAGSVTQNVGVLVPNQSGQATWTVSGTTDGLKEIELTAEADGWDETFTFSENTNLLVDSTGPTSAMGTVNTYSQSKALPVNWSATDTGSGITSYELEVKKGNDGWTSLGELPASQTSYTYTADEGQSYSFRIRAKDALGNVGDWAEGQTTTIDTKAPTLSLVSPTKKLYRYDTAKIGVNAKDTISGIATKRYSLNNGQYKTFTGESFSFQGTSANYSITVEAVDGAGNKAQAKTSLTFHNILLDPELKITKIWRKRKHVWVKGTIRPGALGNIKLIAKRKKKGAFRAQGKPVKASNVNGTFKAKLKLKKKARYRFQATWPGNASFLPGSAFKEKRI